MGPRDASASKNIFIKGGEGGVSYRLSPDYFQLNFGAMKNLSTEFGMTFTLGDQVQKAKLLDSFLYSTYLNLVKMYCLSLYKLDDFISI